MCSQPAHKASVAGRPRVDKQMTGGELTNSGIRERFAAEKSKTVHGRTTEDLEAGNEYNGRNQAS
jgi:hypothetical protein